MTEKQAQSCCVVCKTEKEIQDSLPLIRSEQGNWIIQPVCPDCRQALVREARVAGKFVPFYSLENSEKEAFKRNHLTQSLRPFLEQYARPRQLKAEVKPKPKLAVAKA